MKTPSLFQSLLAMTLVVAAAASCRNESRKSTEVENHRDAASEISEDMEASLPALPYIAIFDDTSEKLGVEKNPDFNGSSLTVDALTQALITNYPEIKPEVDRISNDTLYVRIADAQYLTQQMGSSGAMMYLLEATYAYTELPEVNAVNFSFKEGDHAIPGTYTRERFK